MEIPFSREELEEATLESLRRNHLREGYIRPLVFIGDGAMGLHPGDNPVRVAVIAWEWGKYLGEEGLRKGIRAKVSTFARHHVNAKMTKGKTCGDYVNSILAKREALLDRLRRGDHARHTGAGIRSERRECLRRSRRCLADATSAFCPRWDHPRDGL